MRKTLYPIGRAKRVGTLVRFVRRVMHLDQCNARACFARVTLITRVSIAHKYRWEKGYIIAVKQLEDAIFAMTHYAQMLNTDVHIDSAVCMCDARDDRDARNARYIRSTHPRDSGAAKAARLVKRWWSFEFRIALACRYVYYMFSIDINTIMHPLLFVSHPFILHGDVFDADLTLANPPNVLIVFTYIYSRPLL